MLVVLPFAIPRAEDAPTPVFPTAAVSRVIPPGACVLTDQASLLIAASRFSSDVPGCSLMVDATGTDFVLGQGRDGFTAGRVPAVAAVWRQAFGAAQYVLLTPLQRPADRLDARAEVLLHAEFRACARPWAPLSLYIRQGVRIQP